MMKRVKFSLGILIFLVAFIFSSFGVGADSNLISIDVENEEISYVLSEITQKGNLNLTLSKNVTGRVTVKLKDVKLEDALKAVLGPNNYSYTIDGNIVNVYSYDELQQRERFNPLVTKVFTLQNVDVSALRRVFLSMKTPRGKVEFNLKGNQAVVTDTPRKIKEIERALKDIDIERELRKYKLKYAEAEEIREKLLQIIPKDKGEVFVDKRTNSVVVKAASPLLQNMDDLIKGWDVQPKQVLIEAKILEVTLSEETKLGIDWQYQAPSSVSAQGEPVGLDLKGSFPLDLTSGGIFQIGTLSANDYQATLEFLETKANTEVLSSPRIVVINNHEARILVGSSEPYIVTSQDPNTGFITEDTKFKEVGLKLIVTPKIGEDDFITMKIHPEVSTARRVAEVDNALAVDTTEADTTMMVKDGETVVLGGLMRTEKIKTVKKIPLLGDIPILGYLFRSKETKNVKTELLVFITPHILTNENRARISRQDIKGVVKRTKTEFNLLSEDIKFEQE